MGSRFGRVLLVATAVLIVLGGGVAAALLASSEDGGDSAQLGGAVETGTPDGPDPAGTTRDTDSPAPAETGVPAEPEAEQEPAGGGASGSGSSGNGTSGSGASGAPRETDFPREREQSAQDDPPERVFNVPPAREFTGTGNARLGTVNVREPVLVKWTTRGRFELRFGREAFPIIAPSPSGQLVVPAFNFEAVRVIAKGRWKITITPQR